MTTARKTSRELHDAVQRECPVAGTFWRHREKGMLVRIVGGVVIESSCELGVCYSHDLVTWMRPLAEFLDKFEPMPR